MEKEPEALEIVWEPTPTTFRKHRGWKWEVLLRPVKAAPGSPARIRTHPKKSTAYSERERIRKRLRIVAPLEDWKLEVRTIKDDTGMYGVWATYLGMMTEMESARREKKRREHSERIKEGNEAKRLRKALQAGAVPDITRPRRR